MWKGCLLLALALGVLGCQKPPESGGGALKIVYIPKNAGNPYFSDAIRGFEDACKELGCDFTTTAPATADATSQIPTIKEQVQRRVDVIAITPNSPDALNKALDEAREKGILVICVDADLDKNQSHRDAAVLPTDFTKVGESQIELLGAQIGYEGEIAILSATRDAPNQNAWIAGMRQVIEQPKYAKMKLVDVVYGDDEPQKSMTEMEALLSKYPNLRGVIAPTTVGVAAAAQSLQVAGAYPGGSNARGSGIALTGLGTPDQMRGFIESGVVQSVQLWSPHDMGYLACYLAKELHSKKGRAEKGSEISAGKLGKVTVGEAGVVVTGPLVTFDKSNIANYRF